MKPVSILGVCLLLNLPAASVGADPTPSKTITFTGMCDASGAVPIDRNRFAVANDEDNVLRVYDVQRGGAPIESIDLSPSLPLGNLRKKDGTLKSPPESDLEAATRIGNEAYWLTSHGRNSKGKLRPERLILFATTIPKPGGGLVVVGKPYLSLLADLTQVEALRAYDLAAAAERAPKEAGGFNIEGLTAKLDGKGAFIGLRNPVPEGRAIIVPLDNPREVVRGQRARFGSPALLDLGGQGVRSLSSWRGQYLIVAGNFGEGGQSHLFSWNGRGKPQPIESADLAGFNPEGFFTPEDRNEFLLLSDDGGSLIDGQPCKDLTEPAAKRFRGLWLQIPDLAKRAKH